jgi:small subunit ribosomal protein S20
MPVTKTAKRALRGSKRKEAVNKKAISGLEISLRVAKTSKKDEDIKKAISLADRAAKKHIIHKNKAGRIKSSLAKLLPKKSVKTTKVAKKATKSSKKK